jgi:hypothetical protein
MREENVLHLQSISTDNEEKESNVNDSLSIVSVEGEFDTRIDIIRPSPEKKVKISISSSPKLVATDTGVGIIMVASAPPFSDDEINYENTYQQERQKESQQEEEPCVCVICYETFEEPVELIRGRNYTSEELEDIEGKGKIIDFCQTCKYNVHHRCIDEYRLNKMGDIIRSSYQRGRAQSPIVTGTFGMRCLMCSKEVEKIHISEDGEVSIEKIHPSYAANTEQRQQQQLQIEELMRNRMQRRLRRRQQLEFCRKKICSICFMFLVVITLLVLVFRVI